MKVDLRIRLAGRWGQASGGTVDVLVGEVLHLIRLDQARHDSALRARAHHGHGVALLLQVLQLLRGAGALGALFAELGGDAVELLAHVELQLVLGQLKVVLLLQAEQHAAEVVADKVFEEGVGGVAFREAFLLQDLVGEVGASLEGATLGEA